MQEINPVYNFTVGQEGEYTKIVYNKTPVSNGILLPIALYTIIPAAFISSAFFEKSHSMAPGFIFWLVLMAVIPGGILYFINSGRTTGEIKLSKTQLLAHGKSYQLDHIGAFIIKDRQGAEITERTQISTGYYPPNLSGGVQALSNGMSGVSRSLSNSVKKKLNAAGFRIAIRYASKEIIIADHLGEFEAEALFDKLIQTAGYTKSN